MHKLSHLKEVRPRTSQFYFWPMHTGCMEPEFSCHLLGKNTFNHDTCEYQWFIYLLFCFCPFIHDDLKSLIFTQFSFLVRSIYYLERYKTLTKALAVSTVTHLFNWIIIYSTCTNFKCKIWGLFCCLFLLLLNLTGFRKKI